MKFLIRYSLIFILALMWIPRISAQTITTTAGTVTSCAGDVVVPLDVSGFTSVSAMSLVLQYDTAVLTYTGYQNLRSDLVSTAVINQDKDQFIITWYSLTPVTLADGSFIELLFTTNGGTSDLVWDVSTQGNCEFSDQDANVMDAAFINGQVNAPGMTAHIYTQPVSKQVIDGNNTYFDFSVDGASYFQWQESTDGGSTWSDLANGGIYSGTTGSYFTIYGVTLGMDGNMYRCIVEGICPPADTTNSVVLNVKPVPPTVTMTAGTVTSCAGNIVVPIDIQEFLGVAAFSLTLNFDTAVLTYTGYQGLSDSINAATFVFNHYNNQVIMTWYTTTPVNITSDTLVELLFTSAGQYSGLIWDTETEGNCEIVDVDGQPIFTVYQNGNVNSPGDPPLINSQPADIAILQGGNASFSVNAYSVNTFSWQVSADSGSTWTDLADDATYSNTGWYNLIITSADLSMSGYRYRCLLTGPCEPDTLTRAATLTVNPYPQIITATLPMATRCEDTLTIPLQVENFNDVAAISMVIDFDTSLLVYTGLENLHPALTGSVVDNDVNNRIFISWASITPVSIGDTVLLELGFTAKQDGSGILSWNTEAPGNVEFSDPDGQVIQQALVNGSVSIQVTAAEDVSFTGLDSVYCSNGLVSTLAGTPAGGTFTGPGITGSDFDPLIAGAGTHTITYVYTNLYGCEYTASELALVLDLPAAPLVTASGGPDFCLGDSVVLSATAGFDSYLWSTGDTTESIVIFTSGGYSVSGGNAGVCFSEVSDTTTLTVQLPPVADFSYTVDLLELTLTNLSANATAYSWDFGDGQSSTDTDPVHEYAAMNNYSVVLTALSACGSDTAIQVINLTGNNSPVTDNPVADQVFEAGFGSSTINLGGVFSDPDGDTLTLSAASDNLSVVTVSISDTTLIITEAGTGTAIVTVTAGDGHSGTASSAFMVTVNALPGLSLSYSKHDVSTAGGHDGSIEITPSGGTPPYTYHWSNGASTAVISRLYPGAYTVLVTDAGMNTSTETIEITAPSGQTCDIDIGFTYLQDTTAGKVSFTPSSTAYALRWSFGDGYTSTQNEPVYQYAHPGVYQVCLNAYEQASNCSYETCAIIQVGLLNCVADFSFYVDQADSMLLYFTDNSSGGVSSWYWNFADGGISTDQHPHHTFTKAGTYQVCLYTFDNATGCLSEACREITIGTVGLVAGFTYYIDPDSLKATCTNNSLGSITDYYWTYGDGSVDTWKNSTHIYEDPGVYYVCLTISNSATGKHDNICHRIMVGTVDCDINADFSYFVDPSTRKVNFLNNSSGTVNAYFWNFGDGTSSTLPDPNHQFNKPGYYLVGLSVRDTIAGCNDFHVEMIQTGQAECRSSFSASVDPASLTVTLEDQSLGDIGGYYWTFDDGYTSTDSDPVHQFDAPGVHKISLTVINQTGACMDYSYKMVQVGYTDCSADFTVFIDSLSNTAWFNSQSLGRLIKYYWIFSDGTVSTDKNPKHTFTVPGYHKISLNTFNELSGCMDYHETVILIGSQGIDCEADFIYQSGETSNTVTFADRSLGEGLSWYWNFGDGDFSTLQNPVHEYDEEGYYNVCLTVYSNTGIQNTACRQVPAGVPATVKCLANFIYSVSDDNLKVNYTDKSFGSPDAWSWEFGDDQSASVQHPSHTFTEADYYTTHMKIENQASGCVSDAYALVNVGMGGELFAGFGYIYKSTITTKAESYPVDYVGVSLGDASKYKWSFGDGAYDSTTTTPNHVYTAPGIYYVCLTVYDEVAGTENTTCDSVHVPLTTSTEDIFNNAAIQLRCYPNPADDLYYVLFDLPSASFTEVALYAISGKKFRQVVNDKLNMGRHNIELDATDLANGLYIIRLQSVSGTATRILSVQH